MENLFDTLKGGKNMSVYVLKEQHDHLQELLNREKKAKEWAQKEYCRVQSKLEKTDAELENKNAIIKNLDKTLQRYEKENRALRQLVELWI